MYINNNNDILTLLFVEEDDEDFMFSYLKPKKKGEQICSSIAVQKVFTKC
jgi:hypothetical protein